MLRCQAKLPPGSARKNGRLQMLLIGAVARCEEAWEQVRQKMLGYKRSLKRASGFVITRLSLSRRKKARTTLFQRFKTCIIC